MISIHLVKQITLNPRKIPGVAVYKQNHGTGHALRQMIYTDAIINKMAVDGNSKGRAIAQAINSNPEIKSALKLAAYCKRIGRTLDHEKIIVALQLFIRNALQTSLNR